MHTVSSVTDDKKRFRQLSLRESSGDRGRRTDLYYATDKSLRYARVRDYHGGPDSSWTTELFYDASGNETYRKLTEEVSDSADTDGKTRRKRIGLQTRRRNHRYLRAYINPGE